MSKIHPLAVVEDGAVLGADVEVGPYAIIGANAVIGNGCKIYGHAMVSGNTKLGEQCEVHPFAHIGGKTQDLKYDGGTTYVEIGDRTMLRECVTVNSGTRDGEVTRVGSNCLLMACSHVAHGCEIGNHVILANSTAVAGEVKIEDHATISGLCGIHQFCRIGCHVMMGPSTMIFQDVPPYMLVSGQPVAVHGVNAVGLSRRGFGEDIRSALKSAYKILYRSGLNVTDALAKIEQELPQLPELAHLADFYRTSTRGVVR